MLDTSRMAANSDNLHPSAEDLIGQNPHADLTQVREANRLIGLLRDEGIVSAPTYEISSPYERHCPAPHVR